ncbi:MAG: hypothetical protein FJX67_06835 [Alphaproteobacteria bacterium]|nr:hypothetical protein [Alphaproteobacteria bacterium]
MFGKDSKAGPSSTMALNPGLWMRNGPNTITVESRAKKPGGEARVVIVRSISEKPEFERTIAGTGTVTHQTNGGGLPQWSFYGAEAWTGDTKAVLDAVKTLHAAFGRKDITTIEATRKAFEADLTQVMGPMPDEAREEFREIVKTGKLATLPADLRVTAHLDNRLFVVARANGEAPIQVAHPSGDPMMTFDTGQYWVRSGGTWQIVR